MKIGRISVLFLLLVVFMTTMLAENSYARRWHRVARRRGAVVVAPTKVVVSPKPKVIVVAKDSTEVVITENELTLSEKKEKSIGPEYGLIDFEVYPYGTKIYVDGDYKGYARTLNKDSYSKKIRKGKHIIELKEKDAPAKVIKITVKAGYKTTIQQD